MALLIAVTIVFAYSASSIRFRDGLARAFEGNSDAFRQYETFASNAAVGESDIFVLAENIDLSRPSHVASLSNYIIDALLMDDITGVASAFSFDRDSDPVFSDVRDDLAANLARIEQLRNSQPAIDRFYNPKEMTALIILATDDLLGSTDERSALLHSLRMLGKSVQEESGIRFAVTGYPAVGNTVLSMLFGEFVFLNLFGIAAGILVATLSFRNWRMGLLAAAATGFSLTWAFGFVAFFGFQLNAVTVVLPTLIMALSFADSTHLGLEIRRRFLAGKQRPIRSAITTILPAGILASLTTATAFGVLQFAPSTLLGEMGFAGLAATLIATATVFISLPMMIALVSTFFDAGILFEDNASRQLETLSFSRSITLMVENAGAVTAAGLVLLGVSVFLYAQLPKDYSLYEGLSDTSPPLVAIRKIERTLSPTGTLHFTVPANPVENLVAARDALAEATAPERVYSIFDLADPSLQGAVDALPEELRHRFLTADGKFAILTTPHRYDGSAGVLRRVDEISAKLKAGSDSGDHLEANGFLVMTSRVSSQVLGIFGWCFAVATLVSAVLLIAWTGNPVVGIISMVPNLLPITLFGAGLYLSGGTLNYTTSIALTISFGIAVDDTIHLLNRLRAAVSTSGRSFFTKADVLAAAREAAPAMTITTLVLSIGVSGALLSEMPSVVEYGQLVIITFFLALSLDLLLLPAMLTTAAERLPRSLLQVRT